MRNTLLLILLTLLVILAPQLAAAYDILIIQGQRSPAYEEVVKGFESACTAKSRVVALSDYAEIDVARIVREERPRVVVAVGDQALAAAKKVRQVPVIALLATSLRGPEHPRRNLTGINAFVPPEKYLPVFTALKGNRVGVVFDPARNGWYIRRAAGVVEGAGLGFVARESHSARETINLVSTMKETADLLWMIPDPTTVVRHTLEAVFAYSRDKAVPVVSFSSRHLALGAAAAVEIDRTEAGRQGGEMALAILNGGNAAAIPVSSPRKTVVKTNPSVLSRLGLAAALPVPSN